MQATVAGRGIAWTLLAVLVAVNAAGYLYDLYGQFWWFDRILHACTIFAITLWLALFVFGRTLKGENRYRILNLFLIASVGVALGTLWEVAEWAFDQVAPGDVIKGKYDTLVDILMDTAGALLAGTMALKLSHPLR